ncbi:MAG: glycosyl hydrolase family 28-related protein [Candidatus Acidiferrales bacterium]
MKQTATMHRTLLRLAIFGAILAGAALSAPVSCAQGSRKDGIVFGTTGHPVSEATVTVCQSTATGTPCSPLAAIFTDATLAVPASNPFQTDGLGNYHFYAPAGRYMLQFSGPAIKGTVTIPDVILPADFSSSQPGNNISAFGLTLGGNLTVAGNASVGGTLTTSNFNPGNFTPSSIGVLGNESVAGPRPRLDVTAAPYNAKGDGHTDDTAAINTALAAACNGGVGVEVNFPPGVYLVSQPQAPSTAPVFMLPSGCSGIHLVGEASNGANVQFAMAPMARILVSPGASPNGAPVILMKGSVHGSGNNTIQNLDIEGYNEGVQIVTQANDNLINVCIGVNGTTGLPDNTPLKITNSIWIRMQYGCLMANGSTTTPVMMMTGETPLMGEAPLDGLIYISDIVTAGGGFQYIQRVSQFGTAGNLIFRNITLEDTTAPVLTISAQNGATIGPMDDVSFENVGTSDGAEPSFMSVQAPLHIGGIYMNNISADNNGVTPPAIQATVSGVDLEQVLITASANTAIVNASGNVRGNGVVQNNAGFTTMGTGGQSADCCSIPPANAGGSPSGEPLLAVQPGKTIGSVAIDPALGLALADGTDEGFSASLGQTSEETADLSFASTLPPTGVTATPVAGGAMTAGTPETYVVETEFSGGCSASSSAASPSVTATPSGGNLSVQVTWNAPPSGARTMSGYCVRRLDAGRSAYVSGAGTLTFTDTGSNMTCCQNITYANFMQTVDRFTPAGLGVNTTNPQFNLDVNGTAAVNSLNGVQKAERFSGADAAAKINACLAAAATSSSVCDARGLTGTLTASSHITIPAGTTLLWGQAQLTINDSSTNDAIELAGDGSSLYGYQESGLGTVSAPDTSGFIACGIAGCTTVKKPNPAASKINYVHISGMYLAATGASSKVIDLTSIGHAIIESNNLGLGTGGNSYGIFGDTSTGDFDGTNTLIRHNNMGLNSTGDTCLSLAGVYNAVVVEQNVCTLAPASSFGYVFKKDSNGNYPDNDEIYGNDCEAVSAAFGQICYNIVGALSITFGPNNRCEKVYNCMQFPTDGSANGIHVIDPYLSINNTNQVNPAEPATATIAIDNNGHNWLPSMHYGMNDLAGDNLLGNAGFEGWQNATTLYYWGGASGTTINQPGSGIYAQETSAGANPAADAFTQGTFNVRAGDGATAGLGVNSGCVQVDPQREYTLMFRVASGSTSNNFRPGFRFFSDANCTEANRITSVATNARVLAPVNYAGNLESTNASLTYNNGITCNCNVTGADWQVSTANSWTVNRNYGIIFRVPNAFGSSSTVAHSMRVFLLENTGAAGNYVYFDDVILSQGPATPDIRYAPVRDSGNPAVYGSLGISQHLNQGAANTFAGSVALSGGTAVVTFPTPYNSAPVCVANDTSAIATVRAQATATTLTLSQSSGTDTIAYICVGNPN